MSIANMFMLSTAKNGLRILTGTKRRQIKLQRSNMGVWAVGTLNQLFIRGS